MNPESPSRILLIDDDPDVHDIVEIMLGSLGHQITCCRSGAEGLQAMRRSPPDLLLLDIMLSTATEGVQVACEMRQDPRLKNIPIIFLSSVEQDSEKEYAREVCPVALDADAFLEKPFDTTTVRELVQWVLEQKRGPRPDSPAAPQP